MKKIYITGVSGTGKTTLAKELKKRGYHAISIDEVENLCSWVNQETGNTHMGEAELNPEFVDKHDWICDINLLKRMMEEGANPVFVLGMPGNREQFYPLFDKILLLQCSPEIFCSRIDQRTDNDFGKHPEIRKQILNKFQKYNEDMISKGAIAINTERPINKVADEVILQASF